MTEPKLPIPPQPSFLGNVHEDVNLFFTQLETLQDYYKWDNNEKKMQWLQFYLKDDALNAFHLAKPTQNTYELMKPFLIARFTPNKQSLKNKLKKFRYKNGEDIDSHIEAVKKILQKIEPNMPQSRLCKKILKTLSATLVEKIGILDNSTEQKLKQNIANYEDTIYVRDQINDKDMKETLEKMKKPEPEKEKNIFNVQNQDQQNFKPRQNYTNTRNLSNRPKCFGCGKIGHFRRDCWYNDRNNGQNFQKNYYQSYNNSGGRGYIQNRGGNRNSPPQCSFCGRNGHYANICWFNNQNTNSNGSQNRQWNENRNYNQNNSQGGGYRGKKPYNNNPPKNNSDKKDDKQSEQPKNN